MKLLLLPLLSMASILPNIKISDSDKLNEENTEIRSTTILLQPDPTEVSGRMRSVVFKSQQYCRVELKDFVFDVKFYVVSATVYFTGASFNGVEKGYITSNSLQPVRNLIDRCQPGSIVVFDDVKVKGPENEVRSIAGTAYHLY